jgi:pimeloyl-ACP methyl ester carboxylesterase
MAKDYTEEYVDINGISQYFLHYQANAKEVIIMVHGGPGIPNSYAAYKLIPHFDFCNVVYYDQRGAGKTGIKNKINSDELSLEIYIEDLRKTVQYVKEKYNTDKIFICGHSWGTLVGTHFIVKYPNDVTAYIGHGQMVDTASQDKSWFQFLKVAVMEKGNRQDMKKINSISNDFPLISLENYSKASTILEDLEMKYGYQHIKFLPIYQKSPLMKLKDMFQISKSLKIVKKVSEEAHFNYSVLNISEYKVPVYYILGRYDEWTTSTIAAEYFDKFEAPKKEIYWIENAGHFVDTDQPESFSQAIKEIITRSK